MAGWLFLYWQLLTIIAQIREFKRVIFYLSLLFYYLEYFCKEQCPVISHLVTSKYILYRGGRINACFSLYLQMVCFQNGLLAP